MNEIQFESFIARLRHAYQLKQLPEEVLDFLFQECHFIPSKASIEVFDIFRAHNEKFPMKLDLAILSAYYEWSRNHGEPGRQITRSCPNNVKDEEGPCYQGNLFLYPKEDDGWNERMFLCADCQRSPYWGSRNMFAISLKDALTGGWQIQSHNREIKRPPWLIENMANRGKTKTYGPPLDFGNIVEQWPVHAKEARKDKQERTPYWEY